MRFDSLNNIPYNIDKVKLEYCVQTINDKIIKSGSTSIYDVRDFKCQKLGFRVHLENIAASKDVILYIELKGKLLQ